MSGDGYHMMAPPGGAGPLCVWVMALRDAGVASEEVGYTNAHGTSTMAGDLAETRAVKSIFVIMLSRWQSSH